VRGYVPAYDLRTADTLGEALALLDNEPGRWRPFAGGTDLMVLLEAGRLEHKEFISLWNLRELRFVKVTNGAVEIGASTTYTDVLEHPLLKEEFPLLCQAAAETGGVANQNRGTLGGNIANGSPAADTPPVLLAYDAELEVVSRAATRRVAYEGFHTGYKKMDLRPDELIRSIRLPRGGRVSRQFYRKVGTRRAQAISKVSLAGVLTVAADGTVDDVRIALGSVAPTVARAREAEAAVRGRRIDAVAIASAREALAREIAPIDDIRSTARYRLHVAWNLLEAFLSGAS
jgi:CO/xanthine dehydrogenase FAD-binding subunit